MEENSINKKEVDNEIKINIPIISNQEIENTINTENLYDKIAKQIYHDREMIILQEFIKKLQKENEKALDEYMKWQKQEMEQKDKIIEQMTYYIMNLDIDEDICKEVNCDTNSGELDCKDCIKQYFENKAKEIK